MFIALVVAVAISITTFAANRPAATFTFVTEEGSWLGGSYEYPEEYDLTLAAVAPEKVSSSAGWGISGSVTNNSPRTSDYKIETTVKCGVNLEVTGSGQVVETAQFEFEKVAPGQSKLVTFDIAKSVFDLCIVKSSIIRDLHIGD